MMTIMTADEATRDMVLMWVQYGISWLGVLAAVVYAVRVNDWWWRRHRLGCAIEQLVGGAGACWVVGWTVGGDLGGTTINALVLMTCLLHLSTTAADWYAGVPEEESRPMPLDGATR